MLRRTYKSRDREGKLIVSLPAKDVELVHVAPLPSFHPQLDFSPKEREFYSQLLMKTRTMFNEYLVQGTASRQYARILSLLLSLRQACDHPFLLLSRARGLLKRQGEEDLEQALTQDMIAKIYESAFREKGDAKANAYAASVLRELESEKNIGQQICPICCDSIGVHPVLTKCFHAFCERCIDLMAKQTGVALRFVSHPVPDRLPHLPLPQRPPGSRAHRLSHVRIRQSGLRRRADVAFQHQNRLPPRLASLHLERVSRRSEGCFHRIRKHSHLQPVGGNAQRYRSSIWSGFASRSRCGGRECASFSSMGR